MARTISFKVDARVPMFFFRPMLDGGGRLARKGHLGPIFDSSGRQTSHARDKGSVLDCKPAPHDKTWVEDMKIRPKSTTELYLLAMENYCEGNYNGTFHTWSKFWDYTKVMHGIGHDVYPGMA